MASFKTGRERKQLHAAIDQHGSMVYRLAYRILGNGADAEDAAQEVFVKYLRVRRRGVTTIADERSWLAVTALNGARNFRRGENNRKQREERWAREVGEVRSQGSADGVRAISQAEESDRIWQVALSLPEELKIPLILFYQEEFKYREIAQILGCPEGTVATRIATAKERIKNIVEKRPEGSSHEQQVGFDRRGSSKRA